MTATYEGVGSYASGSDAINVGWPAGWQEGDLMVIAHEMWPSDLPISAPAGWTQAAQHSVENPVGSTANATVTLLVRIAQAGDGAAVNFPDQGNSQSARMAAFRGARSTVIASNTATANYTIDFDIPGVTTAVDNALVLTATAIGDTYTRTWETYGNLTDTGVPINNSNVFGNEGALAMSYGILATAGASGTQETAINTGATENQVAVVVAFESINYVTVTKDLEWYVENGEIDTTILQYQSVAWGVYDAYTDANTEAIGCPLRTHRGLFDDGSTYWIPFYDKSARCTRGPLVNDAYNRYYWTQDDQHMRYAPLQSLLYDTRTEGWDVGVPAPLTAPAVNPSNTETEPVVDRAYVYTFVTQFGEEGPPSPATIASGSDSAVWAIEGMDTDYIASDAYNRPITQKNIYRTVSVNGVAEYHYVASVPMPTPVYNDYRSTEDVGLNFTLESNGWEPPPDYLSGLIAHPNGFLIGYVGRDIYMSVPYRPHAWNPAFVVSTIGDIVGFGIFGTSVVVCTNSHPYVMTGITPEAMVLTKHDTAEPCVARYGIVSMPFGVYYPGPNGLMLASPRGFQNATKELMTKEEWQTRYQVRDFDGARYQQQYVAFYNKTRGIMFDPNEPMAALVDLDLTGAEAEPDQMDTIFTDEYSGRTYIIEQCNMYEWNPVAGAPLEYDWTSMEFDTPEPVNFGAARIVWYSDYTPPTDEQTEEWRSWNVARMADAPLNPLNFHALNEVRQEDPPAVPDIPEIKQPFHWSPLIWVPEVGQLWPNTPFVVFQLLVNETVVFTKTVTHTLPFRLPHGVKGTRFRVRLRSNVNIQSCKLAETGKELAGV